MKPIKISQNQWNRLHHQLLQEYPNSSILIRENLRKRLGFSIRRDHCGIVFLDFFDIKKQSFFILKYSEYVDGID